MLKKIKPYIISVLIALGVGAFSAYLTRGSMNIYSRINTPPFAPPSILFPIVWTALYVLMGISSAMVYTKPPSIKKEKGLLYYASSLAVNFSWSIIFFNFEAFGIAFIMLIALLYLVIMTIISYIKVSKTAALLQIPYALWIIFAGYLNLAIYILN